MLQITEWGNVDLPGSVEAGLANDDGIWLAGSRGLHLIAGGVPHTLDAEVLLNAIVAPDPDRVWVAGARGYIGETDRDGARALLGVGGSIAWPQRLWTADGGHGWLVTFDGVARRVDGRWQREPLAGRRINDVYGVAPDAVWLVGDDGRAEFWNGETLAPQPVSHRLDLRAVWAGARDVAWAVGCGISGFDGERWSLDVDGPDCLGLNDIHGSGPADVWAVGGFGEAAVWHYDGVQWAPYPTVPPVEFRLQYVWAVAPGLVYVSGTRGELYRLDDGEWIAVSPIDVPAAGAIWASGPDDVWVGGITGGTPENMHHYDGVRWTTHQLPSPYAVLDVFGAREGVSVLASANLGGVLARPSE